MKNTIITHIYDRVQKNYSGQAFTASDFFDIGEYKAVSKALERMEDEQKIRRVLRGVYYCPKYSNMLEEYEAPSPHEVALAIARNNNWTIAPCGNTALNQMGLSTQVTANWSYITNGPYKKYKLNEIEIIFKHRSNKEITDKSYKTAMVIQALKIIGRDAITEKHIRIISNNLTEFERYTLMQEGKQTTSWVYSIIKKICERTDENVQSRKAG